MATPPCGSRVLAGQAGGDHHPTHLQEPRLRGQGWEVAGLGDAVAWQTREGGEPEDEEELTGGGDGGQPVQGGHCRVAELL